MSESFIEKVVREARERTEARHEWLNRFEADEWHYPTATDPHGETTTLWQRDGSAISRNAR